MAPPLLFTLTLAVCLLIFTHTSSISLSPSIYDVLKSHGLPMGILPKGITNFTFDPSTSRFAVQMEQSCDTKFETQVRYDWNFSGDVGYGRIANLSGIAAQDLFLWFPVKGIRVDIPTSGLIYFDVGVVYKQFSLSLFETPRDCNTVVDSEDVVVLKDRGVDVDVVESKSGRLRAVV